MSNPITRMQITKIHIAKTQLNINDEHYREMLSGFKNASGDPCSSCKEFTESQANVFLQLLKTKLGWQEKKKNKILEFENLGTRDPKFASPAQLRKIKAYWKNYSREKTDISLNHFISRILKVDMITAVLKQDVNRLLKAIQSLDNQSLHQQKQNTEAGENK